jgi:hypothetical protein
VKKTDWLLIGFSCHLVIVMLWEITAVDVQWSGTKEELQCAPKLACFLFQGEKGQKKKQNRAYGAFQNFVLDLLSFGPRNRQSPSSEQNMQNERNYPQSTQNRAQLKSGNWIGHKSEPAKEMGQEAAGPWQSGPILQQRHKQKQVAFTIAVNSPHVHH